MDVISLDELELLKDVKTYLLKPRIVDALEYTGDNARAIMKFCEDAHGARITPIRGQLVVNTPHSPDIPLKIGDIVTMGNGVCWVYEKKYFEKMYVVKG